MKFHSTRNKGEIVSAPEAIIKGIAPDGGLYVPEYFPKLKALDELIDLDYIELAGYILNLYFDELGKDELLEMAKAAYTDNFPNGQVGLKTYENITFLELFLGKTQAFKDMALSILPHLLVASSEYMKDERTSLILVATSGDTGKAALEGFKDVKGTEVVVYFPKDGVSKVQYLQMATQRGENVNAYGLVGNFDDAQRGVKKLFLDKQLIKELDENGFRFSSANSINIGRLIPQIVYYIYSYLKLVKEEKIKLGQEVNIAVPTGNFGNILAAFYAKEMGLPVDRLILASNENNILVDFFETGEYDSNRKLELTSSPSMDILVSSNLERFLYHKSGGDTEKVKDVMDRLADKGIYTWQGLESEIYPAFANEKEISKAIKEVKEKYNYLIDPHTAVGYKACVDYIKETNDDKMIILASTASPFKFPKKVLEALEIKMPEDELDALEIISENENIPIPKELKELRDLKILHSQALEINNMKKELEDNYGR